jgi:hypothetical protein
MTADSAPPRQRHGRLRGISIVRAPGLLPRLGWILGLVLVLGSGGLLIEALLGRPALGADGGLRLPESQLVGWLGLLIVGAALALGSRLWLDRALAAVPPAHPQVPASLQGDAVWEEE